MSEHTPDSDPEKTFTEDQLRNLLAVIHRDGGHYIVEHGMDKAISDAISLSAKRIHEPEQPAAPELLEALRAVVEDHEERIITTQLPQEQPHRVLVMDNARTAIAKAEGNSA